ncbi:hypothetical protein FRB91_005912 [Serendipita sp. 411]|nr:hypothetical protein FRB91_005912 [Serendipita sp. 411]
MPGVILIKVDALELQVSGEKDVAFENARMSRSLAVGSQFKNRRHTPSGDQASVPLTSSMAPPPVPSTRASIVMPPPSAPPTQASVVMPSLYQTPSRMVNRPSNSSVLQQRPHIIPPTYFPTISLVVQLAPLGGKAGVERQLVKSFGNTAFNLQNNITLDDALREVLISINQDWEKDHQHSIDFEECEFRFPNNYRLQKEDRESTLGQFLLSIQTYRPEFWTPAPGAYAKKPKFSYLYLHVAVDLAMYSRRTDLVESSLHGPSSLRRGKKRAKVDDLIFGQPETKRARGSTILQSSFSGRSLFTVPSASTVTKPISFKISKCYINETTGDAELRLNDGDEEGKISEEPMSLSREDIGQMKHIYEVF